MTLSPNDQKWPVPLSALNAEYFKVPSQQQKPESMNSQRRVILNVYVIQSGKDWDLGPERRDSARSAQNRWCPKEATSLGITGDRLSSSCRTLGRNLRSCDTLFAEPGLVSWGTFLNDGGRNHFVLKRRWNMPNRNTSTQQSAAEVRKADSQ